MLPEERARIKIDKQLNEAGWDIVARNEYVPKSAAAVKEALMQGNTESDYLLFVDDKAIAVVEAKREENPLVDDVENQAEGYSSHPQGWYGLWFDKQIPLVYLANGNKIYFKNMLTDPDGDYIELPAMHSPKKMLQIIGKKSEYGALPRLAKKGLRDCQYDAEANLEASLKVGKKKALSILATGAGKTYLACLASYRLLNYTPTKRVLFLADRNNLARQAESEFSLFDRTEDGKALSELYRINRLKKAEDIKGDVVISTIQKLFAVLTGQAIPDETDEDREDEFSQRDNEKALKETVSLDGKLLLPPDYFQFIVIDECHRSIYGKWRAVLDYFKDAKILGLTATPTPEAYAFFDNNIVEKYTYNESVIDGVNVPARIYRISTNVTVHGGTINAGDTITEKSKKTGVEVERTATERLDFSPTQLDRSITNPKQIETVLAAYRDAIYTDLYPDRTEKWEYIPKTLIFAKDDNHATEIVTAAKKMFGAKFPSGKVPERYIQKITYSADNPNDLIRDLRIEKDFRIAVTVTLVATGTDVRPLEVVLFMNDVKSDILYTQMKGRGCRTINSEIPFDLPETWCWCRLGTLFAHNTGKALNSADSAGTPMTYITTSNLYWDRFELDSLKEMLFADSEIDKCTVKKGDLLVCEGGDIGRSAIWMFEENIRIQNHIHRLRPYISLSGRFYYYVMYMWKQLGLIGGQGIGLQGFSSKLLHNLIVPLPSIDEQERIVAFIDKLFEPIESIEKSLI